MSLCLLFRTVKGGRGHSGQHLFYLIKNMANSILRIQHPSVLFGHSSTGNVMLPGIVPKLIGRSVPV